MANLNALLKELRLVLEASQDSSNSQSSQPSQGEVPNSGDSTNTSCPKGFRFNGKSCVPVEPKSKKFVKTAQPGAEGATNPVEEPPTPNSGEPGEDMPRTRYTPQSKDIPYVPDPEHEIMKYPHNAVMYHNGQRTFEYAGNEYAEYGNNAFTMAKFPDAFTDKNEFIKEYLNGESSAVEDWSSYQHTDAAEQKEADFDGLFNRLWKYASKESEAQGEGAQESFKAKLNDFIKKAMEEQPENTPPVIVGVHVDQNTGKETRYLISGNTRALIYAYLGRSTPIRLVTLKGRLLQDPSEEELKNSLWPAEQSSENPEEVEQAVRAALQRVLKQREGQQAEGQPKAMESLQTVFDGIVKRSKAGQLRETPEEPVGPFKKYTVKRWGKFYYQKREDGKWNKLGIPQKKN